MPVSVIAITDEHHTPKAREQRIMGRIQDAYAAVVAAIALGDGSVRRTFDRYQRAECDLQAYWKRRSHQLERCLFAVLPTELDEDQRERVLTTLRVNRRRDPHLLTEHEQRLIAHYRATDNAGRQMLRMLVQRFAETR